MAPQEKTKYQNTYKITQGNCRDYKVSCNKQPLSIAEQNPNITHFQETFPKCTDRTNLKKHLSFYTWTMANKIIL